MVIEVRRSMLGLYLTQSEGAGIRDGIGTGKCMIGLCDGLADSDRVLTLK